MQPLQTYITEGLSPKDIDEAYEIIEPFLSLKGGDFDKRAPYDYDKFCKEHYEKLERFILKAGGKKRQKLNPKPGEVIMSTANMDVIYIAWLNQENNYTRVSISCLAASDKVHVTLKKVDLKDVEFIWEKGTSIIMPESFKTQALMNFSNFVQKAYA